MHSEYESTMNRNRGCADLILIMVVLFAVVGIVVIAAA